MSPRRDIRLTDLPAQHASIREEIDAAIARVIEGAQFVLGDEVDGFEREFASYCGCTRAVGCGSGSDALLLALMACGVGPGDEVICPAYSFFATASAITRLGARPIFADIDPVSYNLDPEHTRLLATRCSRLRAILPVDLFGQVCDVDALLDLAEALGVALIEDAAQSVGALDARERSAGSRSTIGCFSLYPTKNLGAMGDGGVMTTSSARLAERLSTLRVHGARSRYLHAEVGINSRLDALQAAVLRVKLAHLESWTKSRRENAAYYDRAFSEAGASAGRSARAPQDLELSLITPAAPAPPARHVYHQYVVRVPAERRDPLRAHLHDCGIESEIYYPLGLHQQPCFSSLSSPHVPLPHTEAAARESLALPIHPDLERAQLERVVTAVVDFLRSA